MKFILVKAGKTGVDYDGLITTWGYYDVGRLKFELGSLHDADVSAPKLIDELCSGKPGDYRVIPTNHNTNVIVLFAREEGDAK
jgi:hypothetical protein